MFANNRIDKLTGLKTYEISSMGTSKKARARDVPEGKNSENISKPWYLAVIIFIPMNIKSAKAKVTIK
jgi:hypothetical protein